MSYVEDPFDVPNRLVYEVFQERGVEENVGNFLSRFTGVHLVSDVFQTRVAHFRFCLVRTFNMPLLTSTSEKGPQMTPKYTERHQNDQKDTAQIAGIHSQESGISKPVDDGNHENDENAEGYSDSYKQEVERWIRGNHRNHGNGENYGNPGCKAL